MSTVKTVLILGGIFGLGYLLTLGAKKVAEVANKISVSFLSFGKPRLSGSILTLPISLRIYNPTLVPVPVNNIYSKVYLFKNNEWIQVGVTDNTGAITFQPANSDIKINSRIDLSKVKPTSDSISDIFNVLASSFTQGQSLAKLRIDVIANIAGFDVKQELIQDVSLNQLLLAS